ncbi:hypothetical protein [Pelagicoccus albus]|uniref:Curli production assembly/transport component CsgG n=1 Tax=Pelagicoccus albus TaxID=415222 RepID=A0A7X1B731_9BACT|nr:hypothetical protein [Pelagicoccus albus]MBC2606866.1 hypothetical protein [Pelagicoccus albus]
MNSSQSSYSRFLKAWLYLAFAAAFGTSCSHIPTPKPTRNFDLTPAPYFDTKTGIYFPGALGSLNRSPVVELEKRKPGLGIAISYHNEEARVDIFVYDLQASIIPAGIDSPVVIESFLEAINDLHVAERRRVYSQLDITPERSELLIASPFLEADFSYQETSGPKSGKLLLAGINGQLLKIRAVKSADSELSLDQLLYPIGRAIIHSQTNGYGGVSNTDYQKISNALGAIDLSDGLSSSEAISIAQIELARSGKHNRYDVTSAKVVQMDESQVIIVEFEQFPTTPPRQQDTPLRIAITPSGNAYTLESSP